ncbi:hypothetical protein BCR44DRAFT_1026532 [Catenaria anguillulae PL171]|uniref:Uncharacterized protein n=1 Tax=Catenaria anguillulae PL171 TaxID=765915 RepID=A0A1Y2HTA5_9FUNG|nr:hypothetical protein BCR44DRAFT_1026532 [Catenaria anguillulae PL171]
MHVHNPPTPTQYQQQTQQQQQYIVQSNGSSLGTPTNTSLSNVQLFTSATSSSPFSNNPATNPQSPIQTLPPHLQQSSSATGTQSAAGTPPMTASNPLLPCNRQPWRPRPPRALPWHPRRAARPPNRQPTMPLSTTWQAPWPRPPLPLPWPISTIRSSSSKPDWHNNTRKQMHRVCTKRQGRARTRASLWANACSWIHV